MFNRSIIKNTSIHGPFSMAMLNNQRVIDTYLYGGFCKWGYPIAGWFIPWKILFDKMDDCSGYPYFRKPPYVYIYICIYIPRCSMYGIFTNIYPKNHPNVGKYTIHGAYGI